MNILGLFLATFGPRLVRRFQSKNTKFLWGERTAIKEAIAKLEIMQEAEEKADEDEDEDEIDDIMARL